MNGQTARRKFGEIHEKLAREVILYSVSVRIDGETGDQIKEFNEQKIEAIINANVDNYELKNQGMVYNSTLKMFVLPEVVIKRDDEIVIQEGRFRVDNPTTHIWKNTPVYTDVELYLIKS